MFEVDLLESLKQEGFEFRVDNDKLFVSHPTKQLTEEDRTMIRDNKPGLIRLLVPPRELDYAGAHLDRLDSSVEGFFVLRHYQSECCRKTIRTLSDNLTTLVVMATGLGKTVTFAQICLCWPVHLGRVLVLAHRQELIDQNAEKIEFHTGEPCGIEMGERKESRAGHGLLDRSKVLVSSVQSMSRRLRYFDPEDFGLVIIDEAHHATAKSYLKIINHFQQNPRLRLIGVTATPKRADEVALGQVFKTLSYQMDIHQGISEGWLVNIEQKYIFIKDLDFSLMKTTKGDIDEQDLEVGLLPGKDIDKNRTDLSDEERAILEQQEKMLHAIVDPTVKESAGRSTIVFGVTVDHAKKLCEVFNRHPGVNAEYVVGDTPKEIRKEIIGRFRGGHLQVLVGCAVFTEGFDAPEAAVVAVARPTKSLTLYTQIIGRGTRPLPKTIEHCSSPEERQTAIADSRKPCVTVLDFCGNSGRHKLVSSFDVLGSAEDEDILEAAKEWMRDHDETKNVEEAVAEEKERREKKRRAEEEARVKRYREQQERQKLEDERRRRVLGTANYDARNVDPFGHDVVPSQSLERPRGGASDRQVKLLVHMGVSREAAMALTKLQAGAIISKKKKDVADRNVGKSGGDYSIDFGKHFGKQLKNIPAGYLDWVIQCDGGYEIKNNIRKMRGQP